MNNETQVKVSAGGSFYVVNSLGVELRIGNMVYQPDLPKWGPKKIKKFFFPEGSETVYAQFDEGYGSNDGCLPVNCITTAKPALSQSPSKE